MVLTPKNMIHDIGTSVKIKFWKQWEIFYFQWKSNVDEQSNVRTWKPNWQQQRYNKETDKVFSDQTLQNISNNEI